MDAATAYLLILLAGIIIGGIIAGTLIAGLLRPPYGSYPQGWYAPPPPTPSLGPGFLLLLLVLAVLGLAMLRNQREAPRPVVRETPVEQRYDAYNPTPHDWGDR